MLSIETIILEHLCPSIGVIIGNFMFLAPFQDLRKAVAKGSLGDLNPLPWAFMTGNCLGWVTYSFLIQNIYVFFGNCPGLLLSVYFNLCATKLQYYEYGTNQMKNLLLLSEEEEKEEERNPNCVSVEETVVDDDVLEITANENKISPKNKERLLSQLAVGSFTKNAPAKHEQIVLGIVILWTIVISIISFGTNLEPSDRESIVGVVANINLLFFYGAPLSAIWTVLQTRNSSSIHIPTMITATVNGTFWGAFGFAIMDYYMFIPNGIGVMLGVVQMLLCFIFPRTEIVNKEDAPLSSDDC